MIPLTVLILLLAAAYLYSFFLRALLFWFKNARKAVIRIISAVISLCLAASCLNFYSVMAVVLLYLVLTALFTDLIRLIVRIAHKRGSRFDAVLRCGIVPIVLTAAILFLGYFNIMNVRQTDYSITTSKNIRDEGYRIALISDLHFGTTFDVQALEDYCAEISDLNPDIVILCGDIVDERTTFEEMQSAFASFGQIQSTYGAFFVYGNHDRALYTDSPNFSVAELESAITSSGITIIEDDVISINDEIVLVGRQDRSFGSRSSTAELLSEVNRDNFILLLDHQPVDFSENIDSGVDLQLSGHTHNGQIWPLGLFSRILNITDLVYGYCEIDNFQAITSSGMAGWGYPIRTQGRSEYVIIDINPGG